MPLQQGETIRDGKYHIIEQIGEGGMACVWLAEELTFDKRLVAIKEPRDDLAPTDLVDLQRRYAQEVKVCAALDKVRVPHIVRALTAEPYGESVLLVLEYMPGGDLASLIRQHPKGLPEDRVLAITRDLLSALGGVHAHALEIVHRDIKPSNVLFDGEGRAHLGDFGLAQVAGASGRSQLHGGNHPGTILYMPPEQESSQGYLAPSADLFALGCVLFEMCTGKRYRRVRPGTKVSDLRGGLPGWAEDVVSCLLLDDPWDRYQEVVEIVEAIEQDGDGGNRREAEEQARREAEEQARQETARKAQQEAERKAQEEAEAARRRAEDRARRLAEVQQNAESALIGKRWEEVKDLAREWLDLEPESPRAAALLAQAESMPEIALMSRAESGLVIATPQNISELLDLSAPPDRIWWEKAKMEMCLVPAGEFVMGSGDDDPDAADDEKPQHSVYLDAYYLGRYPVTNAQYQRFVRRKRPPVGKENHPVVRVNWNDARAYCAWAELRLPTEAEWEKAARGTDRRRYPWGNEAPTDELCNFDGNVGATTEVSSYSPQGDSPYGCAVMMGNVWEWTADYGWTDYYSRSPERDPQGPNSGNCRVSRGGSYGNRSNDVRAANREYLDPVYRNVGLGFRCAGSS